MQGFTEHTQDSNIQTQADEPGDALPATLIKTAAAFCEKEA